MTDPTESVLGQDDELRTLDAFLDDLTEGPAVLLLEGEIGAGKTTLWRATTSRARARGYRVLACHPSESDRSLAFAALGDLLDGVLEDEPPIPPPQLRAVRVAVLLDDPGGAPPDLRAVAVGTVGLVRALALRSPVVIAVDDYQWLDPATARVLRFVARRLDREPIGLMIAGREDGGTGLSMLLDRELAERSARRLTPARLGPDAFDALFRSHLGDSFPRPVLREIAGASGGNPLFGLEIARGIRRGDVRAQPGQRLPVPRQLDELVRTRLAGLPAGVRDLLWHVAAVSDPTIELLAAVTDPPLASEALDVAVGAGVVELHGGRVRFTHPLFASTLYHALPSDRRRALHRRLVSLVAGPLDRARHLSLGTTGPDATVAAALVDAAGAAAARGAPDAAASLSEQAWLLTPPKDAGPRHDRRLQAAEYHFASGDTGRARHLLEDILGKLDAGPVRADVLRRLAKVRYRTDSVSIAAELLTRALSEAGPDPELRATIERDLAWAVTLCGDVRDAAQHARTALELVQGNADGGLLPEVLAANGMADFLAGGGTQLELMRRSVALAHPSSEVPIEWRPEMMHAVMLKWSGQLAEAGKRLVVLHEQTIESGDDTSLPYLLAQLSETELWLGHWDSALDHAEEGDRLALQTGQEPIRATVLYAKALVQAHLGLVQEARESAAAGFAASEASGSVLSMMQNQSVLGFLDLSVDDPGAAHEHLAPLEAWLEVVGIREPGVLRFVPDEVEALIALGLLDRADALLRPFEADAARLGRSWAMLASARARALHMAAVGDAASAPQILERALEAFADADQPFARARALLALGTIRRRTRRRAAAREALNAALKIFESLGARLWAAKAERMLGGASLPSSADAPPLTPSEQRVAELVASGATNRAVADRLFVSVRAVEAHLTSIYRKLGIRSRARLAAIMAGPGARRYPRAVRVPGGRCNGKSSTPALESTAPSTVGSGRPLGVRPDERESPPRP